MQAALQQRDERRLVAAADAPAEVHSHCGSTRPGQLPVHVGADHALETPVGEQHEQATRQSPIAIPGMAQVDGGLTR